MNLAYQKTRGSFKNFSLPYYNNGTQKKRSLTNLSTSFSLSLELIDLKSPLKQQREYTTLNFLKLIKNNGKPRTNSTELYHLAPS